MEDAMQVQQQTQNDLTQSMLGMYFETLNRWNKAYDAASRATQERKAPSRMQEQTIDVLREQSQNYAVQCFRRIVENQIGICRFFENRWANYLTLPEMISSCKSPFDLMPLQASFLKQLFVDYTNESVRVMQSFLHVPQCGQSNSRY
jgi:hypothetical protein